MEGKMNGLATRVVTLLSLFFFLAASGFSAESGLLTPEEVKTLMEEKIRRYLSDPTLQELAQVNGFYKDGLGLLRLYNVLGTPKLVNVQGKPVKYLIPIVFSETALAGFIHADPFTGDVLGWPNWDADGKPVYRVSRSEWEETQNASWSESIADIIPPNLLVSPGERVDPYSEKNWRFIDHGLDEMPFKNQEDRGEWIDQMNLQHQPRPRWTRFGTRWRQPALKCLAFAAATCGDWWTMEYARPLGSYTNVINGYREYGHNPRAVEAVFYVRHRLKPLKYFVVPFYPDPVTHEGIPFSLPGYCDVLTRPMRGTLPDPALPSAFSYEFGDNPYCMEKPYLLKKKGH